MQTGKPGNPKNLKSAFLIMELTLKLLPNALWEKKLSK